MTIEIKGSLEVQARPRIRDLEDGQLFIKEGTVCMKTDEGFVYLSGGVHYRHETFPDELSKEAIPVRGELTIK